MQSDLEDTDYAGEDDIRKMGDWTEWTARTIYGGHPKP